MNPILSKEQFPALSLFKPRPTGEPGVALVLYRDGGTSIALSPGQKLTASDIAWGNYKGYYRIDVAEHRYTFQVSVPCDKDAFNFQAEVNVTYRIDDPKDIVDKQVQDTEIILKTEIVRRIRSISRRYNAKQSEAAEDSINEILSKGLKASGILASKISVDLQLEDASKQHLRDLQTIDDNKVRQIKEHELLTLNDKLDIERQKIKMEFYGPLIKEGQWQMLAFQLSKNPNDVATIINAISNQRQLEFNQQLQMLKAMLDGDVIEGWQMEDISKQVLHRLVDNLGITNAKGLLGESKDETEDDKKSEK